MAKAISSRLLKSDSTRRVPLPMLFDGFTQGGDDLRGELDPTRTVRGGLDTVEATHFTPVGDGAHIHIQQRGRGPRTIPSIAPLTLGTSAGRLRAPTGDVIGIAKPLDLAGGEGPALARGEALRVEGGGDLKIGVRRGQPSDPFENGGVGAAGLEDRAGPLQV